MPIYIYKTDDGQLIEEIFSIKDRPDTITLPDGRVAKHSLSKSIPARMALQWQTFPFGMDGRLINTGERIYTTKEYESYLDRNGLINLNESNFHLLEERFSEIESAREADKIRQDKMDSILSIPNPVEREGKFDAEFGDEVAKNAVDIDKKYPELFEPGSQFLHEIKQAQEKANERP